MKRSAQPAQAPAPQTAQDISSELLSIEQSISEGNADAAAALQGISHALASVAAVSGAYIALYQGSQLTCVASTGAAPQVGEPIQPDALMGECLQTGRLIRGSNASQDPRVDPVFRNQFQFESVMVVPVQSRSSASGIMVVLSSEAGGLDQDYVFVLGSAANLAALIAARLPVTNDDEPLVEPPANKIAGALSAAAPGSSIDLTALALSDFIPPAPKSAPDMHELLTTLPSVPVPAAKKVSPAPLVRYAAAVVLALIGFSSFVYPAIRGRHDDPAPKVTVAKPAAPVQGSTDETIGRPKAATSAPNSASIVGGELRRRTAPVYPQNALRNGMQGEVNLLVAIDEAGIVTDARVLSGQADFAEAATSAVSHWRFAPFMADGRPVAVNLPVLIAFRCSAENSASAQASLAPASERQSR